MTTQVTPLSIASAFENFSACKQQEDVWDAFLEMVEPLGIKSAMYMFGEVPTQTNEKCLEAQFASDTFFGSLVSDNFVQTVLADEKLSRIDHFSKHWKQTLEPLLFDCRARAEVPGEVVPLLEVLEDFGVSGGLMIPLRSFDGQHYGNCCLTFDAKHVNDLGSIPVATATALAHILHGHFERRSECSDAPALSPREMECLKWVAEGHSSKMIAERMGLKTHTTNEYIANARKKLGAASRSEAAARAVRFGLISI
ncbi:MAG: LuxR C-terminal-related transcriptional regulator [Pseudomonadota bacterium]